MLEGWERSGLTQREYCRRHGIAVTTFDYYRRRQLKRETEAAAARATALVAVRIAPPPPEESGQEDRRRGFVLALRNGRRIEAGWEFPEAEMARLVRVAEQA